MARQKPKQKTSRPRADGRKSFLVYLPPELIKQLKKLALDEERYAYQITEEALDMWLSAHKKKKKSTAE